MSYEADRVAVTPLGRFFLRNVAVTLDGYRTGTSDEGPRFSRAV
ncbi:MAG: hypothetical protein R2882_12975 [Gemmatimonadales bacterium]